jgi:hypothetical protein
MKINHIIYFDDPTNPSHSLDLVIYDFKRHSASMLSGIEDVEHLGINTFLGLPVFIVSRHFYDIHFPKYKRYKCK